MHIICRAINILTCGSPDRYIERTETIEMQRSPGTRVLSSSQIVRWLSDCLLTWYYRRYYFVLGKKTRIEWSRKTAISGEQNKHSRWPPAVGERLVVLMVLLRYVFVEAADVLRARWFLDFIPFEK
jgi:hypothetical protein